MSLHRPLVFLITSSISWIDPWVNKRLNFNLVTPQLWSMNASISNWQFRTSSMWTPYFGLGTYNLNLSNLNFDLSTLNINKPTLNLELLNLYSSFMPWETCQRSVTGLRRLSLEGGFQLLNRVEYNRRRLICYNEK